MSSKGISIKAVKGTKPKVKEGKGKPTDQKPLLQREIKLFGSGIKDKTKAYFYGELSDLIHAGIDLISALTLVIEQMGKSSEKAHFNDVKQRVIEGAFLYEALQAQKKAFTPYEYYSIQIGEEAGQLVNVLKELHMYYETKLKQRRQILSALSYPIVVVFSAIGVVIFMVGFIVPMFENIFKNFGGELPFITRWIINTSVWVQSNWYMLLILLLVIVVAGILSGKYQGVKKVVQNIGLRNPKLGPIMYAIHFSRF